MLFIHISDIHFKQVEVGQPDDPNLALRNDMIRDVKAMRERIGRPADGVLLSGDVAFAGKAAEYDFAYRWLENELCPAAGCAIDSVFVVPGNHECQSASDRDPGSASKRDPPFLRFERLALAPSELVGVAETGRARVVGA